MKDVHVMSLGGIVIALEQDAKEAISRYIDKNKTKLRGNEAADEILEDLEAAIGTHLTEQGYSQKRAANKKAVDLVLEKMGEVEAQDEASEASGDNAKKSADWRDTFKEPFHLSKTNVVIFGLAGGLAERIGIDAFWLRILFAFLAFATHGWFVMLYIVCGLLISILDEGKPLDAKTISAQVRATSAKTSKTFSKSWHGPAKKVDRIVRLIFRVIFGVIAMIALTCGIGAFSWAMVTMTGKPQFDVPFVGTERSPLAYTLVASGLLLVIWLASHMLFAVIFPGKGKPGKNPWLLFGTIIPTLGLLGVFMSSGYQMRTTIINWADRHPGNRLIEIQRWENGHIYDSCFSPIATCTPQLGPVKEVHQFGPDGEHIILPPR